MDIATLMAANSFWALILGGLLIFRWNGLPDRIDLLWSGAGSIVIGVGTGLFGARYFGSPYFATSIVANATLVTGLAMLVQGTRAADGFKPPVFFLATPAVIWGLACTSEAFRNSHLAAVWLFSLMSFVIAARAGLHLIRGGLVLRGRRVWLGLWVFIAVSMVIRLVDARLVPPGLIDRYADAVLQVIYLTMTAASIVAVGYINLALSDCLYWLNPFVDALERGLSASIGEASGRPEVDQADTGAVLWSLRLDRLPAGRAMARSFTDADISNMVRAIVSSCPEIVLARRAGADRLVWLTRPGAQDYSRQLDALVSRLAAIAERPTFPRFDMSCGMTQFNGGDILLAAAAADRNARLIRAS